MQLNIKLSRKLVVMMFLGVENLVSKRSCSTKCHQMRHSFWKAQARSLRMVYCVVIYFQRHFLTFFCEQIFQIVHLYNFRFGISQVNWISLIPLLILRYWKDDAYLFICYFFLFIFYFLLKFSYCIIIFIYNLI